jgi:hypothetical protein
LQVRAPSEPTLPDIAAAAQLFGGASAAATITPLQLSGIIYSAIPGERVAIITSDAKPARALRLHAEVAPGIIIKQINQRSVVVLENSQQRVIPLPKLSSTAKDKLTPPPEVSSSK